VCDGLAMFAMTFLITTVIARRSAVIAVPQAANIFFENECIIVFALPINFHNFNN
jgi:hypothetical protein